MLQTCSLLTSQSKLNFRFGLHMLCTPPAFVLSQDQTLQYTLLKNRLALNYLIQNFVCLAHLLSAFASSKLARTFAFFLVLVQFSRCCRFPATCIVYYTFEGLSSAFFTFFRKVFSSLFFQAASFKQLSYNNTIFTSCQLLFRYFYKSFNSIALAAPFSYINR